MSANKIILSYHDALIRQSDYKILCSKEWINDNLLEFWFEYLQKELFKNHEENLFCIGPSLSQLIKLTTNIDEIGGILSSLDLQSKQLILLSINDSYLFESAGGSHWSLLVFNAKSSKFEHYDSSFNSCNIHHAEKVAWKLNQLFFPTKQSLNIEKMYCNQQEDSYNCGIHVICNAEGVCKKYFCNDSRPLSDIVSPASIRLTRDRLKQLIDDL